MMMMMIVGVHVGKVELGISVLVNARNCKGIRYMLLGMNSCELLETYS